jgi:RNA polymerase sigma-70 factor, ECF subfamily
MSDAKTTSVTQSETASTQVTREGRFRAAFLHEIPLLQKRARVLSRNRALAEDLTQEALTKAWARRDSFTPGTNLRAWLHVILRNVYFNYLRSRKREIADSEGIFAEQVPVPPAQQSKLELKEVTSMMQQLPDRHREALVLVAGQGKSYKQVARRWQCNIGTVKSRVARARQSMTALLERG